jgi:hypothetical protein
VSGARILRRFGLDLFIKAGHRSITTRMHPKEIAEAINPTPETLA